MTVKDIFELRRQGKIEEAYDAIRPMYAAHKGKYTSLCMFWTASDMFKLRLNQHHIEEARKIFEALKRVLPYIDDRDGKAGAFMQYAARRLAKYKPAIKQQGPPVTPSAKVPTSAPSPLGEGRGEALGEGRGEATPSPSGEGRGEALGEGRGEAGKLVVSLEDGIIRPIEGVNAPQRVVLACIVAHPGYSVPKISESTGIPAKSVERHIAALIDRNLIEHRDSKKTGGYYAR